MANYKYKNTDTWKNKLSDAETIISEILDSKSHEKLDRMLLQYIQGILVDYQEVKDHTHLKESLQDYKRMLNDIILINK